MTTEHTVVTERPTRSAGSRLRAPRSRGAVSGSLLALLGIWGAVVPFVGPYFDFGYAPDSAWTWTAERGWLSVLPGCVTLLAGLVVLLSANRVVAGLAAWLAVAAGGWFIIGSQLAAFAGIDAVGAPSQTGAGMVALQALAYFFALGGVIVFFAGAALGRFSVHSPADTRPAGAGQTDTRPAGAEPADAGLAEPRPAAPGADGPGDAAPDTDARESARAAIARERSRRGPRRFAHRRRAESPEDAAARG